MLDPNLNLKKSISNRLQELFQDMLDNEGVTEDQFRVTRIGPLVFEVKVREENGAPRYFNVKVSEMT
jgi:negative regulator of genetic competence, sporulation and motility